MALLGGRVTRALRGLRPRPLALAAAVLVLAAAAAYALLHSTLAVQETPSGLQAPPEATGALALALANSPQGILDSDRDGLSDALENYVHGTDPLTPSTGGSGIPDGWLARHGFDPRDPAAGTRPAASPAAAELPPSYHGVWPDRFVPTLHEVYRHGRPATWNESADGPFASGIDPRQWDTNRDGIPDGYLMAFGLDPLAGNVSGERRAGPEGLTVREAFEHGTDPSKLDTDGDGIRDKEEIAGPANPSGAAPQRFQPTDPTRFDTSGAGVCDGYLRAHGLEPNSAALAYGDLANSGATTRQKFLWSRERFGDAACSDGQGLSPVKLSTRGLPIPDGWLLRHGLDPLDPAVPGKVVQSSATDPPSCSAPLEGAPALEAVTLTVLDKYRFGRFPGWQEARDGPWWGGMDPGKADSDGDGLPDATELRGYSFAVSTQIGPVPKLEAHHADSDPTAADSDGDGLRDGAEACPALREHGKDKTPTDARRRDTDFDGIDDGPELAGGLGLDPARADTPGDFLRDGERYSLLAARAARYAQGLPYEYPSNFTLPGQWLQKAPGAAALPRPLGHEAMAQLVGPLGRLDGRTPNVLNPDIDGDNLTNGWEVRPALYAFSPHGVGDLESGRPGTDPLNPDTDGDGLPEAWEVQHGKVVVQGNPPHYDLDPSQYDSGSGSCLDGTAACNACPAGAAACGDGQKDFSGNTLHWHSYTGETPNTAREPAHAYPFNNLLKQQHGLDPHKFSSNGDGLGDGWKVFWGIEYPGKSAGLASDLGTVYPGAPNVFLPSGARQSLIQRHLGQAPTASPPLADYAYTRYTTDPGQRLPWETVDGSPFTVPTAPTYTLHRLKGTLPVTLAVAQEFGLNPYMVDSPRSSDGDGMADGWEILHQALHEAGFPGLSRAGCDPTAAPPDPAVPDAVGSPLAVDPDKDGLSNRQEHDAGANPVCADTDMGKVEDGEETGDPADPTDDLDANALGSDQDGDGVKDALEVTGVQSSTLYGHLVLPEGVSIRTNPHAPDGNGSGLLDGPTMPDPATSPGWLLDDSPEGRLAHKFMDLGIAYRTAVSNGVTRYFFWGHADPLVRGDPRLTFVDPAVPIPLGWLVAHHLRDDPNRPAGEYTRYLPYYELGRPDWWEERRHGPWWGGADPNSVDISALQQGADLDCDGLRDRLGDGLYEDPFPFANQKNQWWVFDYSRYGLADPVPGSDPAPPASPDPTVARLWAQAYLNPRQDDGPFVSPPDAHRSPNGCSPSYTAIEPSITGIALGDGSPDSKVLVKGKANEVTGKVVEPGNPFGIPHVTVEAFFLDGLGNPQVFGAGFTDAFGEFRFPVNITSRHSVGLEEDPFRTGLVLRGRTAGTANWTADPSAVEPGEGKTLFLQTYATADTPPFTDQAVPPMKRAEASLAGVTVRSGSRLSFPTLPPQVLAGTPFAIEVKLVDSAGTPLVDHRVQITVEDEEQEAPTDADGIASATFTVSAQQVLDRDGSLEVRVRTLEPAGGNIDNSEISEPLPARLRTTLALDPPPVGEAASAVELTGTLTSPQGGVPGAFVWANVTGPGSAFLPGTGTTQQKGRFAISIPLPANLTFGEYVVSVHASPTATTAAASSSRALQVRSLPLIVGMPVSPLRASGPATVSGMLVEPGGATPVAGAPLEVSLDERRTVATTADDGTFSVSFPGPFPGRPLLQAVMFAGDDRHVATQGSVERTVLMDTRVGVPAGILARGAAASIPIHLLTTLGDPVPGVFLQTQWGGEPPLSILTSGNGAATFTRPGTPADRLGPVVLRAWYNGSADGLWGANASSAVWTVRTLARLDLPNGTFDAGSFIPPAVLQDAGTQAPLANARVRIRLGTTNATAVTGETGRFPLFDLPPRDADPFTVHVRVDYAGDAVYPPTSAQANLTVRSPVSLAPRPLPFLVAGQPTVYIVEMRDGRDRPVDGGWLNVTLDGAAVGSAPARDGFALVVLTLPANRSAGDATLQVAYGGTATHGTARTVAPLRVLAPVELAVAAEATEPGKVAQIRVTATAGGRPLGFAPLQLDVAGLGGLQATTDKDGVATFLVPQGNSTLLLAARYAGGSQLGPALTTASLAPLVPETPLEAGLRVGAWLAGGAAVLLAAAAVVARRLRRHPLDPALRRARRAILGRGTYETQVIQAYQAIEDSAIAHEILEAPANTPRLLQAAIAATIAPSLRPSLERLITLFEQARYGVARLGPAHRDAAVQALDDLRRQLSRMDPFWPDTAPPRLGRPTR